MVDKRIDQLTGATAVSAADLLAIWDTSAAATVQVEVGEIVPHGAHYIEYKTHSVAGALSCMWRGRASVVIVTVSANITSWTDNLNEGEQMLVWLLGNGTGTFTAALSALDVEGGGNLGTITIYPTSEIGLIIRKRGSNLWTTVHRQVSASGPLFPERVVTLTTLTANSAVTIDWSQGNHFRLDCAGFDVTSMSDTNGPTSGYVCAGTIEFTNSAGTASTVDSTGLAHGLEASFDVAAGGSEMLQLWSTP